MVEAAAGAAVRFYGTIANTPDTLRTPLQEAVERRAAAALCVRLRRAPAAGSKKTLATLDFECVGVFCRRRGILNSKPRLPDAPS